MCESFLQTSPHRDHALFLRCNKPKLFASIIKGVCVSSLCCVFASSDHGLKVTVESEKCVQANAYIPSSFFDEFCVPSTANNNDSNGVSFKVNVYTLIECLLIFTSSSLNSSSSPPCLKLYYFGEGTSLLLQLECNGVITECSIKSLNFQSDELLAFSFSPSSVTNKIILKSEGLKEALNELNLGSESIGILTTPTKPFFRLSTCSVFGNIHIDYPRESYLVEVFECKDRQRHEYKMNLVRPSFRALAISNKTSIRLDENGFLSLQFLIKNSESDAIFIEYLISPNQYDEYDNVV